MTTATVAAQQRAEHLGRFPVAWNTGSTGSSSTTATQFTMNDTQQQQQQQQPHQQPPLLHTSDTSPQQQQQQSNANGGSGLSIAANLALLTGSSVGGSNGTPPNNITGNSSNNNNSSNNSGGGNTGGSKSRNVSLNDTKMEHHLREQQQQQHHTHHHQSSQQQQQASQHALHSRLRGGVSPTPSEQQYALKWNDFQSSILSSFRHLRDEEDFVDVTIACDTRSFTAHKVVLSACSPYFRKLLKANPCEHPIVILRDVRSDDIENLLRFMYNGEVHIGQDQLSDFLKTAQLLQVRGLADVTSGANPTGGRTSANSSMLNSSLSTPAVQELKASPTSTSLPWELPEDNTPAPPPQKRTKSSELYRKQHGLSPDDPIPLDLLPIGQHPLTRDRSKDKSKQHDHHHHHQQQQQQQQQAAQHHLHRGSSEHDLHHHHHLRERDRSLELRESLLGQALEGGPTLTLPSKHADLLLQASGEDSNSSDTAASDHGDDIEGLNGNVEHTRPSFPFLQGLQGIPGLIPGPSGMHGDNFVSRRSLEMRVRATDPRPCPKCGKIYRSAHTLRTHLEDKHTVCPGYRCVLCGTVAKSRNSLHSHMSRQHRGISTKDLPVLPMPSPFDPELASRLLAKAGVKISPAELRARASPTGTRRNDGMKLELRSGDGGEDFDDPEDLTMSQSSHSETQRRFHESMMAMSPTGDSTPKLGLDGLGRDAGNGAGNGNGGAGTGGNGNGGAGAANSLGGPDRHGGGPGGGPMNHMQPNAPTGSAILDTYLQFITENAFGMSGMTQEQAAAAALQAAKIAHLKSLGHNLEQLPPGFLPPHLDLAKLTSNNNQNNPDLSPLGKLQSSPNVTMESSATGGNRPGSVEAERLLQSANHQKLLALAASHAPGGNGGAGTGGNHGLNNNNNSILNSDAIRRGGSSEPMDLGLDGSGPMHDDDGNSSADERNYSDDESIATH
ncbi:protein abrupt-like isoform X5 [Anopheles albimanus]|uniref:protein abrupt-like isoform X5 n=1 Tax=Anopheles albimanus TaxID=7167 RepID=UPI0016419030|nr:protein abrupt-like isoform X5 [Anopheles albimanus]